MSNVSRRHLLSALGLSALASAAEALPRADRDTAAGTPPLPERDPALLDLLPERLAAADRMVAEAVTRGVPGAVLVVGRRGAVALRKAYGYAALRPERRPMTPETVFDLASLTKVVATTTAVARLLDEGRIALDAPVGRYLPPFAAAGGDKARITVRHLMTHASGLPAGGAYAGKQRTTPQIVAEIAGGRQIAPPGERFLYSDFSYITLGALVEAVTAKALDVYCREAVFGPLGMAETGYRPNADLAARCAATTAGDDTAANRGRVHDPTAAALGGVAGHAGLFSTADDLARFCQMLLNGGAYAGVRLLRPETVALLTAKQSPFVGNARGLGWDLDSFYSIRGALLPGSFGHTGFTGTSLWIDPATQAFVILLTNAVHARPAVGVSGLRGSVSTAVAAALADVSQGPGRIPATLPASLDDRAPVRTGLDALTAEAFRRLEGRNVGLICNHTAVDRQGQHLADLLHANRKVSVVALFGPEHSLRGDVDAGVDNTLDPKTGLTVYSLYNLKLPRERRYRPTPEMLKGIDTLVFDIQDIGARYYTYIATMGYVMEAAARQGIRVVILDRPNPLGGLLVEGPNLLPNYFGFTGYHNMPITHGMTVGELAGLFNAERKIGAQIEVVKCEGWNRRLLHDQTGLPWVNPSPNIRNIRQAALYPGVGFLEALPLSVGRGTDTPFEIIGAPWMDGLALETDLSARRLPGVSFTTTRFTPTGSKHKGVACGGLQIHLWDRRLCRPSELGIHLADALARHHPKELNAQTLSAMKGMIGNDTIPKGLAGGAAPESLIASWETDVADWRRRRAPFLLYG